MNRRSMRVAVPAMAVLIVAECLAQVPADRPAPDLTGPTIFRQVARANADRATDLQAYVSTRQYTVLEPGHPPDANLVVSMQFAAPSTKTFGEAAEDGIGWIDKRVFHGLMHAEQEAATEPQKSRSALTPANYDAELVGEDRCHDRDCYVLALRPKRADKYLLTGRIWVDKTDLAIARVEGEPVKSPSFWVQHVHLVREYQRIGRFWLPLQDQTLCHIRFVGDYLLEIHYYNYEVTPAE